MLALVVGSQQLVAPPLLGPCQRPAATPRCTNLLTQSLVRAREAAREQNVAALHLGFPLGPRNHGMLGLAETRLSPAAGQWVDVLLGPVNDLPMVTPLCFLYYPQRSSTRKQRNASISFQEAIRGAFAEGDGNTRNTARRCENK